MCEGEDNSKISKRIYQEKSLISKFNLPEPRESQPLSEQARNINKEIGDMQDSNHTIGEHYKQNETQRFQNKYGLGLPRKRETLTNEDINFLKYNSHRVRSIVRAGKSYMENETQKFGDN